MTIKLKIFLLIIICLLGGGIYSNALQSPFQFDDIGFIVNNPNIKDLVNFEAIWNTLRQKTRAVGFYTFALNYHFHGLDVFGYHLVNVMIHLINTILVWWFVQLIFTTTRMKGENIARYQNPISLLTALLFLAHPIQTQAVTYITQRFACLATCFYLLSVCFYMKGRLTTAHLGKSIFYFLLSAVSCLLGMFTKEIVFTLPFIIILSEFTFLRQEKQRFRMIFLFPILLFCLIVPIMFSFNVEKILFTSIPSGSHDGDMITSGSYLLTQFRVIVTYLKLLVFPQSLNFDYDFILSKNIFDIATLLSIATLALVMFLACKLLRKHVLIAFGIFWFFITLIVESSFIPIRHVIFEHRVYLPSVGFCLAAITGLFVIFNDVKRFAVVSTVLILLFSFLTFQRNEVWKDEIVFWTDVIEKSPNKSRGYNNLGFAYLEQGNFKKAVELLTKAIEMNPGKAQSYTNRGHAYSQLGDLELALEDLNRALKMNPNDPFSYLHRGEVFLKMQQVDLAMKDYSRFNEIGTNYADGYNRIGLAYFSLGKLKKALSAFEHALSLMPDSVAAHNNLGLVYGRLGLSQKSIESYKRAIFLDSRYAKAYINLGKAYYTAGKNEQATEVLSKAIEFDPENPIAQHNLGVLFYKKGEFTRSIQLFKRAIELNPTYEKAYYFLALAYNDLGMKDEFDYISFMLKKIQQRTEDSF